MRRIDIFVRVTCYPETMLMARIVEKTCSINFQNKAVYRAEDRPLDIRLKMTFTR